MEENYESMHERIKVSMLVKSSVSRASCVFLKCVRIACRCMCICDWYNSMTDLIQTESHVVCDTTDSSDATSTQLQVCPVGQVLTHQLSIAFSRSRSENLSLNMFAGNLQPSHHNQMTRGTSRWGAVGGGSARGGRQKGRDKKEKRKEGKKGRDRRRDTRGGGTREGETRDEKSQR